ncbi:MAG: hypothetical protein JXB47_19915 [Anaerolineae bacterium]|nr:hypothetical protein [Anaerolineae bacterium]
MDDLGAAAAKIGEEIDELVEVIDPITAPSEVIGALEEVKRLYDAAAKLLAGVAKGQEQAARAKKPTLGIGAYLRSISDGHTMANAAVLLATIHLRGRVEGKKA